MEEWQTGARPAARSGCRLAPAGCRLPRLGATLLRIRAGPLAVGLHVRAPDKRHQRRHQERAHDERVDEDADSEQEGELTERPPAGPGMTQHAQDGGHSRLPALVLCSSCVSPRRCASMPCLSARGPPSARGCRARTRSRRHPPRGAPRTADRRPAHEVEPQMRPIAGRWPRRARRATQTTTIDERSQPGWSLRCSRAVCVTVGLARLLSAGRCAGSFFFRRSPPSRPESAPVRTRQATPAAASRRPGARRSTVIAIPGPKSRKNRLDATVRAAVPAATISPSATISGVYCSVVRRAAAPRRPSAGQRATHSRRGRRSRSR